MRDQFSAYYQPTESDFKRLWGEAFVALDANVLLNLYRYPTAARDELLTLMQHLSERLIIPYQVALEYQTNRLRVIAAQKRRFSDVKKVLDDTERQLKVELNKLDLERRHSIIVVDTLLAEAQALFTKYKDSLNDQEKRQPDVWNDDGIRSALDTILKGRVGKTPTQTELDSIFTEGRKRFEERVPPGFKDESKKDDKLPYLRSNMLRIERRFGDLIIWKQLIATAKERGLKSLILVTDDEKPDWWWEVESLGRKTIGPRPELLEEMKSEAGVDLFYIYTSERFLEAARKELGFAVSQTTIDQVGDVRESLKIDKPLKFGEGIQAAVRDWLKAGLHVGEVITQNRTFPDLTVSSARGNIHYEITYISKRSLSLMSEESFLRHRTLQDVRRMFYVLVAKSSEKLDALEDDVQRVIDKIPTDAFVIIGFVNFSDSKPVFQGSKFEVGRRLI